MIFFSPIRLTPWSLMHIKSCSFIPPASGKYTGIKEMRHWFWLTGLVTVIVKCLKKELCHFKHFIVKGRKFSRRIPLLSISAPMVASSLMSYPSLPNPVSWYSHFSCLPTALIKITEWFILNCPIKNNIGWKSLTPVLLTGLNTLKYSMNI